MAQANFSREKQQRPDLLELPASDASSARSAPLADEKARPTAPLNPWFSIWIRPRKTVRQIVDTDPTYHVYSLAALAGVAYALNEASSGSVGDDLALPVILLSFSVFGALGGLLSLLIMGGIVRWTGSWLGGTASSQEVRTALAWSWVPAIWAMLLWIPRLAIFREELFSSAMPRTETSLFLTLLLSGLALVQLLISLWSFIVLVQALAEVHRFSAWRALGSAVLGGILLSLPFLFLGFVAGLVAV